MAEATTPDGVQIDLVSGQRMEGLASMEKIRIILDGVHDGNIVILEEGLTPEEESRLIEVTMTEIDPEAEAMMDRLEELAEELEAAQPPMQQPPAQQPPQ